jgi:glutaredoxin
VTALTIYSRPGCHLCDEMKATVYRAVKSSPHPVSIEEIDISSDEELDRRYGQDIPVLMVDGRKAAKYRVTEKDVRRMIAARASKSQGSTLNSQDIKT